MKNYCEICGKRTYLEKHHIISKSKGGSNHKSNLTNICSECHTLVHRGDIIIEGKFMTSQGAKIIFHNQNESSLTGKTTDVFLIK
jgi:hypothetical protein